MHITLTGNLGSGKSTICDILKEQYGFEVYSTGTVQRRLAEEMGLTVLEMNKKMCDDPSFDHAIDDRTIQIAKENTDRNLIFDSRLAWHFVEHSFKVFLSVNIDEAARRIWNANRGFVEKYTSVQDAKDKIIQRAQTEDTRYKDLYNIEYFNFSNYDLVLDSTYLSPEELSELIVSEAKLFEKKKGCYGLGENKVLMSPYRLHSDQTEIEMIPMKNKKAMYDAALLVAVREDGADYLVLDGKAMQQKLIDDGYRLVNIRIS